MATLMALNDWLNDQARREKSTTSRHPSTTNKPDQSTALAHSLQKVTTAVARYHRAGPTYKKKSEAFWIFAAGCWTREQYDEEVREAIKRLPKAKSVDADLNAGRRLVWEGVECLRKADMRDARDLEEALRGFEGTGGQW